MRIIPQLNGRLEAMKTKSLINAILPLFNEHVWYFAYVIITTVLYILTLSHNTHQYLIFAFLICAIIPIGIDAIKDLMQKQIGTEFFLLFATAIGLLGKQERAICSILMIMLIAKFTEQLIKERTDRAIESLIKFVPTDVSIRLAGNQEKTVPIAQVQENTLVIIKTGNRIPADGVIVEGDAGINESFLTGESIPQQKRVSDFVFAGSFLETGGIVVRVTKVGKETLFSKISKLVEQAETNKATIVTLSNKIASFLVPFSILFIAITWLITHDFDLVVTLLVFGAPVELTLVTPLAILAGMVAAFRHGILIKGSRALEHLSKISTIIFDKTGTLTMGTPKVAEIVTADTTHTVHDILGLAAMIEMRSGHILSKAILEKAQESNSIITAPDTYESITGHGVVVTHNNQRYALGSKHFIEAAEHENCIIQKEMLCPEPAIHSSFYLCHNTHLLGRICVTDIIREDACATLTHLKNLGIKKTILLSGDKKEVAQNIAKKLGIDIAYGEAEPAQKLQIIKELQDQGEFVVMVGDGINDAPALKQANAGIAMGAMGAEPAIAAADIVLMRNNLEDIVFVVQLSQKVFRLIKQNIFFGFALIHLIGTILAFMHMITPIHAAITHAISDVFILINSARLINYKP